MKRQAGKTTPSSTRKIPLWKDADPGIDEVDDARKRLAGLKSQKP